MDIRQLENDNRLDLVNPSQYRMWHDGQNVLIPVGKSISQPLQKEIVPVNTRVYGDVNKSYFKAPVVDFTNTEVNEKRFDYYRLPIHRDDYFTNGWDNQEIDIFNDLGIVKINIYVDILLGCVFEDVTPTTAFGGYKSMLPLMRDINGIWSTERISESDFWPNRNLRLTYDFDISSDTTSTFFDVSFKSDVDAHKTKIPLYLRVKNIKGIVGNSVISLSNKNTMFTILKSRFNLQIVSAEGV